MIARASGPSAQSPTADDFFARQVDAWVDRDGGVVDPDGGLDDDYDDALAASWGDEAWDDADGIRTVVRSTAVPSLCVLYLVENLE